MSDDLVTFLRARLDEVEALARAATPGPWVGRDLEDAVDPTIHAAAVDEWGEPIYVAQTAYDGLDFTTANSVADARHILRHDPARVLAQVAAKRRIVEIHGYEHSCVDVTGMDDYVWPRSTPPSYCATLRLLSALHADHPDYDESWRP